MNILGLDPGLRITGYGVIEQAGQHLAYRASGVVRTTATVDKKDLPARLAILFRGVQDMVEQFQPDAAVVEKVFVNVNPQSTLLLGQARGAIIAALTYMQLPVFEYTALQVKQAVVGNGHADKTQVQHMVKRLLQLPAEPSADAADALACAICHAHGGQGLGAILTAGRRRKSGRIL